VVGVLLLNQEVSWLVLFLSEWNELRQLSSLWLLLSVVDLMSINNNVLAEVLISAQTMIVWRRWLVNGPVVEWWVHNWIFGLGLNQVITVNSIDDKISKLQILVSSITMIVWRRWLVHGPVVEWWVPHWVFSLKLHVHVVSMLLVEVKLIWANTDLLKAKSGSGHGVLSHHRLWVNSDWRSLSLSKVNLIRFFDLGEFHGNWSWLISDEVLKGTEGNILTEERRHDGGVRLLGELHGNWGWLVSDEVLEGTEGNVLTEEGRHDGGITLLGKLDSDWGWLVSDEVLKCTKGNILTEERRHDG